MKLYDSDGYFLKSERLGFRVWTGAMIPLAISLWGDPEVSRHVGGPFTVEQIAERVEFEMANDSSRGIQYWPFFILETGEFAGCSGLKPYGADGSGFETGFYLMKKFWGAGLAREASETVIRYAFEKLNISEIHAGHKPSNEASKKLISKLGFRHVRDEFYPPTGLMHPLYVLTPEAFSRGRAPADAS